MSVIDSAISMAHLSFSSGTFQIWLQVTDLLYPVVEQSAQISYRIHFNSWKVSGQATSKDRLLVPFHIDNGIFLLITPFPDPSLLVKLSNGETVPTDKLTSDSVLVLMGRGLTDWLLQVALHCYRTRFLRHRHCRRISWSVWPQSVFLV
jgi:hypothetical protein